MRYQDIKEEIQQDSKIDITKLDAESLIIPNLVSKWSDVFINESALYKDYDVAYKKLIKDKTEYYLGKCPDSVYELHPLDHKILRQDVGAYLDADDELIAVDKKRHLQKLKCDVIEQFIKSLNQRTFLIKNALDFMKFKNGIN